MFFFSLFIFSQLSGVFLHVMADTLGSVGVIISAGLIYQIGKLFCWYCSKNLLWISLISTPSTACKDFCLRYN